MSQNAVRLAVASILVALPSLAAAQEAPAGGASDSGGGPGPGVIQVSPGQPVYPGPLPPAGYNPDAHLPSSARSSTDISRSQDGFDLLPKAGGAASVRGGSGGAFVVEGQFVPENHTVRRGDTLWDISGRYYQNPYNWPRIWGQNPQIQNPHWIYPGDRIRLREAGSAPTVGHVGFSGRRTVPPQTIFLRDTGWIDDRKEDTWGTVVGSPSDKRLLSFGDVIYVQLQDDHDVGVGSELTIFKPIRSIDSDRVKGELVSIRGTAKIDRFNAKTKMARARIIESVDVIERGERVGPVGRKFDVVPPVASDRDLEANLLTSVYPNQVFGQNQVVFIDRGEADGVRPGQRFFAIRRGDPWFQTLGTAGRMARLRPRVEDDRPAKVDDVPGAPDEDKLPDETYAELRVLRVRKHSATALVVASRHEIERSARLVSRKGY